MSASDPPPEHVWPEMSPEEEAELRHAFAEARENGEGISREELFARLRSQEPIEIEPDEEAELERRSREAHDLDAQGLLISGDDHIRKLRARVEQRRAG